MAPTLKPAITKEKKKRSTRKKVPPSEQKLEPTLWAAADKLRGNMDAAEYKHVALGLIFLKYISDAFEEFRAKLNQDIENPESELYVKRPEDRLATLEDRDEYVAANIFWVPKEARWQHLLANAKQPTIGKTLDDAMIAIELFPLSVTDGSEIVKADNERCTVLREFEDRASRHKLNVSLRSSRGLRSRNPAERMNFWWYEPQHSKDRAPIKTRDSRQ
jgi:hypothetical protein